jgi:DNA-binding response OmpR family regulator
MNIEKTTTDFSTNGSETTTNRLELHREALQSPRSRVGRHRIMVVEDHEDTLILLQRLLELAGYAVQGATTVAEALEKFERARFDLLIADIGLPDGSGLEVIQQARLHQPELRGIALTGFGSDQDALCINQAGFEMHLVKPIDIAKLKAAIRQSFESS